MSSRICVHQSEHFCTACNRQLINEKCIPDLITNSLLFITGQTWYSPQQPAGIDINEPTMHVLLAIPVTLT